MIALFRRWGELVTISHTIFAMPFAAAAVVLALAEPHASLTPLRVLAMVVCMVAARTSAMAFNRWADRDVDAKNPRTEGAPGPGGRIRPAEALALTALAGAAFCAIAATLGFWPAVLAPPVLAVLLGYSLREALHVGRARVARRSRSRSRRAARGSRWARAERRHRAASCSRRLTWLFGFDVLYALQDEHFDRAAGLHSVPARFGAKRAMLMAGRRMS